MAKDKEPRQIVSESASVLHAASSRILQFGLDHFSWDTRLGGEQTLPVALHRAATMRLVLALCLCTVQAFQTPRPRPAARIQRRAFLDDDDVSDSA